MTVLKSIVLALALANVGYFLWLRGVAHAVPVAVAEPTTLLKLASEAPAAIAGAPAGAADRAADDSPAAPNNAKRCVTVGPFREVADAVHAAGTLRAGGYDPRQRVAEGEVWAGVWVFIPLPPNRAATDQMLAKLKANGVEDAVEMPGPADESVISLGLFSEQKRAQGRVAQVHTLGLRPEMADRKRNGNLYWVDVDVKPGAAPPNPADFQGEAGRIQRLEFKPCSAATDAQP